jgi:hypothetical protein
MPDRLSDIRVLALRRFDNTQILRLQANSDVAVSVTLRSGTQARLEVGYRLMDTSAAFRNCRLFTAAADEMHAIMVRFSPDDAKSSQHWLQALRRDVAAALGPGVRA